MYKKRMRIVSILLTLAMLLASVGFTALSAGAADVKYGDADRNGSVNLSDVLCIQKYLAKVIGAEAIDREAADVTGEGDLNTQDALCIQKYLARIIDTFPAEQQAQQVAMTFNVTIPEPIPEGAKVSIGTNFNDWNPADPAWVMTPVDELHYTLTQFADKQYIGKEVQYKYTVQVEGQDSMWARVEGGAEGGEIDNRTFTLEEGGNTVNDTVAMFKNQTGQNSVTGGTLETFTLPMPQYTDGRERTIRVWVPDGYDPENKDKLYPVLYMHDGQNVFDSFTSFAGEWKVDETIAEMMAKGYEGSIVVGIDNASDRINEYTPDWPNVDSSTADNPSGNLYAKFIAETLKPYIDSHYNVRTGKESTSIGGSSMGGLISYYIGLEYPEVFGNILVFSPSFWLFGEKTLGDVIAAQDFTDTENLPKFFLYAGGSGGEGSITPFIDFTKNKMIECGYPEAKLNSLVDKSQTHSESAWSKYFPQAYQWLVGFTEPEKDFYRIYFDTSAAEWPEAYICMWIGGQNFVKMEPVAGRPGVYSYDLPKEQVEFLLRSDIEFNDWGTHATDNITFTPANENMVYVLKPGGSEGKYTGEWQGLPPLPEKDAYRVYFDVSNAADWAEPYICMWIGGENFVKLNPVDGKPGIFSYDLPKEQVEFMLRSDLDFSFWGSHATENISFSPENENMVFVLAPNSSGGKYTGSWQAYEAG